MNAIRAICFDLDNTLWDVWPVIHRAEQAMYDFLRERYPRMIANTTIEAMREARERVALEHPQMQHDFSFLRQQALRDHARLTGYAAEIADEAFDVFIAARNEVELYPDVLPSLQVLHTKFRLFTASNGNADLAKIGLSHLFERTIAARHVGALKPDVRVFHSVIEGTDLRADQVLYVGDDPSHDVEGARRAGMQATWVNRTGAQWPDGLEPPTHEVATLIELANALGCQVNRSQNASAPGANSG